MERKGSTRIDDDETAPVTPDSPEDGTLPPEDTEQPVEQTPEEAENRFDDKEILGHSVRVRLEVNETARELVSSADETWAKMRNLVESPRRKYREFRMTIAKLRLKSKQKRADRKIAKRDAKYDNRATRLNTKLDKRRKEAQERVDNTTSNRLRTRRQDKLDAKHAKKADKIQRRLAKHKENKTISNNIDREDVETYKEKAFDVWKERHDESVDAASGRLSGAEKRSAERSAVIERKRNVARGKAELAIARKELRSTLRGPENKASRRETREILAEVFGSGDGAVGEQALRSLAGKVVARSRAERSQRSVDAQARDSERQVENAQKTIEHSASEALRLDRSADHDDKVYEQYASELLPKLREQLGFAEDMDREAPEMTSSLRHELAQAEATMLTLQQSAISKRAQAQELRKKAGSLQRKLPLLQAEAIRRKTAADNERASTTAAREQAARSARSILGETEPATEERNV